MTKTTNYQLPKWEKTDRIMMDDFNDAMSKIDAAVAAANDAAAALSGGLKIYHGTYEGTGETNQVRYEIGARPSLLILATDNEISGSSFHRFLIGTKDYCLSISSTGSQSFITNFMTADQTGFTLNHGIMYANQGYNALGSMQTYWAFC